MEKKLVSDRAEKTFLLAKWDQMKSAGGAFVAFTVDVIYGRRHDRKARIWGGCLFVLSLIFCFVSVSRYWLYKHRFLRARHLGCLVVVVGNLTVGGTGKTPVVEKLARTLHKNGRKVAILSRGYKSKREPLWRRWKRSLLQQPEPEPRVVSDGKTIFYDSEIAGDEPYMLARNLPGVLVVTDKDRVKAGQFAIRRYGVDTLILDDGFQYYQLQDHLQLLLIDKTNPFGNGHLLPRGILREPISQMRRASYVFLTKSESPADAELVTTLRRYRRESNWVECAHRPKYFEAVNGLRREELAFVKGAKLGALSGIAAPESFESFLRDLGASEVIPFRFLDHHRFTEEELHRIVAQGQAERIDYLITTEKDAVRISRDLVTPMPFFYLRVEIHMLAGSESFEQAVKRICFPRQNDSGNRFAEA